MWAERLDDLDSSLDRSLGGAAIGQPGTVIDFSGLGPLPDALRQRAAELLARVTGVEDLVAQRIAQVDKALRLGSPGARIRADLTPAPAYLDHLA